MYWVLQEAAKGIEGLVRKVDLQVVRWKAGNLVAKEGRALKDTGMGCDGGFFIARANDEPDDGRLQVLEEDGLRIGCGNLGLLRVCDAVVTSICHFFLPGHLDIVCCLGNLRSLEVGHRGRDSVQVRRLKWSPVGKKRSRRKTQYYY